MGNVALEHKITIAIAATGTEFSGNVNGDSGQLPARGIIYMITVNFPNVTNAITYSVKVRDRDDNTLFTSVSTLAENAFSEIHEDANGDKLDCPVSENFDILLTLSGAAGSTGNAIVRLYYIR